MVRRRFWGGWILAILLLTLLLAACGGAAPGSPENGTGSGETGNSEYPLVVEDAVGRKVEIGSRPERLGSMAPSVTETIFAVGAGERLSGVTTADDYPPEAKEIESIGDYREPNVEKVLALEIDLLFISFDSATAEAAEELERKTKATVVVINPKTVDEAVSSVGLVGRIVGEREKASALEGRLRGDLEEVENAVAGQPRPTVFYEVWDDPLQTVGPGSFIHDAIEQAGGRNIAADTGQAYPSYSEETLLKKDPDYYLISSTTPEEVEKRPAYASLTAVERGQVSVVDPDLVTRPGPRVVEGVRRIAESIHPEAFQKEAA